MIRFLLKLARSKPVTTAYPSQPVRSARGVRGTPVLDPERCDLEAACQEICPTGAIQVMKSSAGGAWQIDYGNCIFCGACVQGCPQGAIAATDAFELTARSRERAAVTYTVGGGR